jgi:hypothetical protein
MTEDEIEAYKLGEIPGARSTTPSSSDVEQQDVLTVEESVTEAVAQLTVSVEETQAPATAEATTQVATFDTLVAQSTLPEASSTGTINVSVQTAPSDFATTVLRPEPPGDDSADPAESFSIITLFKSISVDAYTIPREFELAIQRSQSETAGKETFERRRFTSVVAGSC